MGYHEREYQKRLSLAQERNNLIMLIAINVVLFVILIFIRAVYALQNPDSAIASAKFDANVLRWFSIPSDLSELAQRPWTVITYMFVHTGVWHILGNMLWLWVFGYILHDLTGNRKIVPIYLYGGLLGAVAYVAAYNLLPGLSPQVSTSQMIGASGGVMAVAAAVTTLAPGYRLFPMLNGGIPIWLVTALYLIIDLAFLPSNNSGGHLAHLAGALAGFLFVIAHQRGYDAGAWMNKTFDWTINLFNPEKTSRKRDLKKELFYKANTSPYRKTPNITEQRIDEILDKINQKGYDSLSEEEKELLKRASDAQ